MLSKSKNPMQKRVKLVLSLLCLPSLFSCNLDEIFAENPNRMEVMMTIGSRYYTGEVSTSYSAFGDPTNVEDIIYRVEHGENVIFVFTKEGCSSCESFLKNAGYYIWGKNYRISYIENNTKEAAEEISKYAVEKGLERTISRPIDGSTPSMYIMSKEKIVELIYGSTKNDQKVIATAFKEYVKECNVYHSTFTKWILPYYMYRDVVEGPTYVLGETSKDDFYTNIYPIVSKSDKKFNVLEISSNEEYSGDLQAFYKKVGTEDVEGKLLYVDIADTSKDEYENSITVIDDAETYLKENYVSSSL